MRNGIPSYLRTLTDQVVTASVTPVDITGSGILLPATKELIIKATLPFSVGASGGFLFLLNSTQVLVDYLADYIVDDGVTADPGAQIAKIIVAQANFANAYASRAGNSTCSLFASLKGHATIDSTVSIQFACNSGAGAITILKGAFIEYIRL